ncbi:hypothetical protein ACWFRM_34835 [Streptomyces sp. NPDC055144]
MTRYNAYGPVLQLAMFEDDRVCEAAVEEVCARLRAELGASG